MSRAALLVRAGAALLVVLLLAAALAGRKVMPSLWVRAEGEAVLMANQAIYTALDRAMAGLAGQSVLRVRAEGGAVRYVEPDTALLQGLAARVLVGLQEEMRRRDHWLLYIPLAQLLGDGLWAGWGPRIPVRVEPVGTARIEFRDRFEGAGINQTRYALYLEVATGVVVAVPFFTRRVDVTCSVPLAQAVIVGEVPPGMLYFPPGPGY